MAFPERFLDELTERNDIVDVVSQYVRLGESLRSVPVPQRENALVLRCSR